MRAQCSSAAWVVARATRIMVSPFAPLVALLVASVCSRAAADKLEVVGPLVSQNGRSYRAVGPSLPSGCLYEGRWYTDGSTVSTGETCLHCACSHGALTCRRRSCAPLPDPPPHRCHILHRRGSCCPELHCPDGIILMEHGATARFENDDLDIDAPTSLSHACVEGGTVYAAGSAMRSTVACEQCFCLGGARRCVRPRCLPPPAGCRPRPAPGACCPQRYYCEHRVNNSPEEKHPHDCKVDGKWISEGEKVISSKSSNCSQCFCLRGVVQCQPLACAPPLMDCKPLLRPGECCAHQYVCDRIQQGPFQSQMLTLSTDARSSARNNNQPPKLNNIESTTKTTLASLYNVKNTHNTSTKNHLVSTTKVKRKTSDPPIINVINSTTTTTTKVPQEPTTMAKMIATTDDATSTTEVTTEITTTEQPEGSVKIIVNGTINCTAELSSTSLPLNISTNDTEKINMESEPRVPIIDVSNLEDHTFSLNDIITDRTVNGNFDDNESFVINVTSSLMTNTSKPSTKAPTATVSMVSLPADIVEALNTSKKTKGDYDFDYSQPTLPPSLPNLKIIPFVAADAVVEEESPKETLTYPMLEREDKFPVYYPTVETKATPYTNRREDTYRPTQYPVFITDKMDHDYKVDEEYPSLAQDIDLTSTGYSNVPNIQPELGTAMNEFTVSANLGNHITELKKAVTEGPITSTTLKLETPVVNLFSPPVETEGGFIPKGPGIIDEYFAVFPSTPAPPHMPHLTTSMQLDVAKAGECISSDGRHVPEGDTITLACSECTCAWGELHCSPRPCHTPSGCKRRPASSNVADLCCGDLICEEDNKSTTTLEPVTTKPNSVEKGPHLTNTTKTNEGEIRTDEPVKIINQTSTIAKQNTVDKVNTTTAVPIVEKTTTKRPETTTSRVVKEPENNNHSLEYDDEEEDEGFSFGSVLKLLLSDSYETTTTPPKKTTTVKTTIPPKLHTTTRRPKPTPSPNTNKPVVNSFVPLPIHPFTPPKISHNPINRIDHLVLGEATAIKKTSPRPMLTTSKPLLTNRPTMRPSTKKSVEVTKKEESYTTQESPRPPGGLGPDLLKLAGCNIYGRMYRVGRIIAELSTPCQECWCTEFGVQCKQLKC